MQNFSFRMVLDVIEFHIRIITINLFRLKAVQARLIEHSLSKHWEIIDKIFFSSKTPTAKNIADKKISFRYMCFCFSVLKCIYSKFVLSIYTKFCDLKKKRPLWSKIIFGLHFSVFSVWHNWAFLWFSTFRYQWFFAP